MHTFGMTEHYVILVEYPLVVNPLSILLSGKPFIENKDHVVLQERPSRRGYTTHDENDRFQKRRMERTKRRLMMKSNDSTPFVTPSAIEGIITKLSPFSVEETFQRLQEAIQSRNLSLFAHIDHSGEAKRVGLTMQEAHVLIFGSPKAGTPLMIASPLLALDLPLKVLVWQGNDGHVWVSYTSIAYLTVRYSIPQDLTRNIAGIDGLIESVLRS